MAETLSGNDNFSKASNEDILKTIEKLLGPINNSGQFTEECVLPSGRKVVHHVTLASGFFSLKLLSEYRSKFGEPPNWLKFFHPSHRCTLFRMAQETNSRLPEFLDDLSAYIQNTL